MFTSVSSSTGIHCVVKDSREEDIFFAWSQLTAREYAQGKKLCEKRQKLYVLGRCAVKQAVCEYHSSLSGRHLDPAEIEIYATTHQGPSFRILTTETDDWHRVLPRLDISIAHSHEVAVACVGYKAFFSSVGVDIEKIREFKLETIVGFLTRTEIDQYEHIADEFGRMTFLTRRWCIKEAYMKAKKVGLRLHPQRISVTELDLSRYSIAEDGKQISATVQCVVQKGQYCIAAVALKV